MFYVISGTFHIDGYTPDGDSLHFQAHNADNWGKLGGQAVKLNPRGQAQLRLEGIDALEMNFEGRHQPLKYAQAARDFMLSHLGVRSNLFGPAHARDGAAGFIFSRQADKYRRPVAFVFAGAPAWPDGEKIFLDAAHIRKSVNYLLLQAGLVYPTYYEGLEAHLREELTRACREARRERRGLWPRDCTNSGIIINEGLSGLEKQIMLPKLFRRLVRYFMENRHLGGFQEYLETTPEPVMHLPTGSRSGLASLIEVQERSVRLLVAPEELLFLEDGK